MSERTFQKPVSASIRALNPDVFGKSATTSDLKSNVAPPAKSTLAVQFESMWAALTGAPPYATEVTVCEERRWRWDYFWPVQSVALELQGGIYRMGVGGHGSAKQYRLDCEKANYAACHGVTLFRLATGQVTPENVAMIYKHLTRKP